jgi:flagellar biosynthesis/type III secretory pathway protein FliH
MEMLSYEDMSRVDPLVYRRYIMNECDRAAFANLLEEGREEVLQEGRKEGWELGLQEGREAAREEILRVLRSKSALSDGQLAQMFNMPITLIEKL